MMPAALQQRMRHVSIETTTRYYVGRGAEAVADAFWEAVESTNEQTRSNKSGNKGLNSQLHIAQQDSQTLAS